MGWRLQGVHKHRGSRLEEQILQLVIIGSSINFLEIMISFIKLIDCRKKGTPLPIVTALCVPDECSERDIAHMLNSGSQQADLI
jgi:hypothetical protein